MKLNLKVRIKNPVFWVQVVLAVLMPILAYWGLALEDLTSWSKVFELIFDAVSNPYVLGLVAVSVFNAVNDPTTRGIKDSDKALEYTEPK